MQTPSNAEMEARFNLFVTTGDRARLAGRFDEAATAYKAALDIHLHPAIRGRLGLVLVRLGHIDKAAEELHEAVERGQGVSLQERREVAAAYDKAKSLTTWVTVNVSQLGAIVTCDGVPWAKGLASFWRFAMPGEHTLRATLDGYEDAEATFTAKPGDEITVNLRLVPRISATPPDQSKVLLERLRRKKLVFPPHIRTTNVADDPAYDGHEDPYYGERNALETKPAPKKTGPRFSVHAGVVTVFGVASWNPAVGPVVGVGLRPHENISFGLEGRAAWLTTGVGGRQISAMTAGGLLSVCGHVKWFFGCPMGHLGVIRTEGVESTFSEAPFNNFRPGVGARVGVRLRPTQQLSLQATVDALAFAYRTRVFIGNEKIVDQPAAMISTQIAGGWEFWP